jgi:hypothetical protein
MLGFAAGEGGGGEGRALLNLVVFRESFYFVGRGRGLVDTDGFDFLFFFFLFSLNKNYRSSPSITSKIGKFTAHRYPFHSIWEGV